MPNLFHRYSLRNDWMTNREELKNMNTKFDKFLLQRNYAVHPTEAVVFEVIEY